MSMQQASSGGDTEGLTRALEKLIEVLSRPSIPADKVLWDASMVGAYLGVSARQVAERYCFRRGFPDTIQLPTDGGKGQKRWKAKEVMDWAERQR